jgi:fibronectin-binding autotransporter adhesin
VISGSAGVGLNFWGNGSGTINLTNAANSFTGPININGAEVQFQNDGSFGAVPGSVTPGAIVIDGGRLTSADGGGNAVNFTLNSSRGIQVGATAGTSISVKSGTGSLTYNGIIADKPSSTGTLV